jgi:hypothetical protein
VRCRSGAWAWQLACSRALASLGGQGENLQFPIGQISERGALAGLAGNCTLATQFAATLLLHVGQQVGRQCYDCVGVGGNRDASVGLCQVERGLWPGTFDAASFSASGQQPTSALTDGLGN